MAAPPEADKFRPFLENIYSDKLCRNKVDADTNLKSGKYYGWIQHDAAHINACVLAGEYDKTSQQFCLVFPVSINNGSTSNSQHNSLDVRQPPDRLCFDAKMTTVSDIAAHMHQINSSRKSMLPGPSSS